MITLRPVWLTPVSLLVLMLLQIEGMQAAEQTRVACVGDSITAGARVDAVQSYPSRLQELLGDKYQVENFGLGSATLIKPGRPNVWQKLDQIKSFQPHVVVISLGTNDTVGGKRKNWEKIDRFEQDYAELIETLSQLASRPRIVICTPTAMVLSAKGLSPSRLANLTERQPRLQQLCKRIRQLAADHVGKRVSLLELNAVLRGKPDLVTEGDGVHPNQEGYLAIAKAVAEHLHDPPTPTRRPNILLIITDQQHASMMSCAGNRQLSTPALDSLAKQGVRFTNAYVTNPVCVPSRISMATGVMAGRFGVLTNGMKATIPEPVRQNSLGMLMKRAGYATYYGGKSHLPAELAPQNAGYDETFKDPRKALPGACIDFIERRKDKPFFVVASFINPHDICFAYRAYKGKSPQGASSVEHLYQQALSLPEVQLPPLPDNFRIPQLEPNAIELFANPNAVTPSITMRRTYDERQWRIYRWIYCRLTEQVDRHIGRILDALKRRGIENQTLVVFTSDHGDMDACHRLASKGCFYEQSARVPFLMRMPGQIVAGKVDQRLVSSGLDLLPTLCDYAGVEPPQGLLGQSLRGLAEGETVETWREYLVTENQTGRMLRTDRFKYCVYREGEVRESFVDLQNDPGEMNNLVADAEYAATLEQHRKKLADWIELSGDADARSFMATRSQ